MKIITGLIYRNQLGFVDINATESKSLRINNLACPEFNVIFEAVTIEIMNKYLVERVVFLSLRCGRGPNTPKGHFRLF